MIHRGKGALDATLQMRCTGETKRFVQWNKDAIRELLEFLAEKPHDCETTLEIGGWRVTIDESYLGTNLDAQTRERIRRQRNL